jgi:hypothetical protein
VSDTKTIWIYRRYGDVEGMGEYISWKPEGFDKAREYIMKSEYDQVVSKKQARIEKLEAALTKIKNVNPELTDTVGQVMILVAREALEKGRAK